MGAKIRIERRQNPRSRFATGPGAAWKWLYDVTMPDGSSATYGTDLLSAARRMANDAAVRWSVVNRCDKPTIVLAWESK